MINVETKVSEYLLKLCDKLQYGSISIDKLPINEIKDIYAKAMSGHKDINVMEYMDVLIEQNILLLGQAIKDNNIMITIMVLQLMACQCSHSQGVDVFWANTCEGQIKGCENYFLDFRECNETVQQAYRKKYVSPMNNNYFKGKGVVYTAVTGGYDKIKEPEFISPDLDYICFTDNQDYKSDKWEVRFVKNEDKLDNIRLARKYKILAHEILQEYDFSVWLDGKMQLLRDPRDFINQYSISSSMLAFPHYVRDCIYEEALACVACKKGNVDEINWQMERYRQEGYPEHFGLIDTACLVRNHHDELLKKVMKTWWNEVKTGSYRDQLSFNYACWKHNYEYDLCNMFLYNNSCLAMYEHN